MSKRALDSGLNNVWYELGVRHALRARGVVLVRGPRPNQPFDIYTCLLYTSRCV